MAWVRLLEEDAPEGEEMLEDLELRSLPDVGDRIAIHGPEGEVVVFEVLGRTFEVVVGEEGEAVGEERVTLDVERLHAVPDEDVLAAEHNH